MTLSVEIQQLESLCAEQVPQEQIDAVAKSMIEWHRRFLGKNPNNILERVVKGETTFKEMCKHYLTRHIKKGEEESELSYFWLENEGMMNLIPMLDYNTYIGILDNTIKRLYS